MTLKSPNNDWDITKSLTFTRYSNLYIQRRPSTIGKRMKRADNAMDRMWAWPRVPEPLVSLLFNEQYHLEASIYDIRYFAILDMVIGLDSEIVKRYVRNHDDIYTRRMPWKMMRFPFIQHILNEYGYRVVRG